jgi:CheY-like chemotaxis protein
MASECPELGGSATILIVEDDPLVATYIKEVLAESGMRVAGTAGSGLEALAIAAKQQISLALVDIRLTGPIDGIELACLLRDRDQVPVIFLSGQVDPAIIARAQSAKPVALLAKPFRPSQVFNAIERALRAKGKLD